MKIQNILVCIILISLFNCKNDDPITNSADSTVCSSENLLTSFIDPSSNLNVFIYSNGELFVNENESCNFELQYFDPDFLSSNYTFLNDDIFIKSGDDNFPVKNDFIENFESYTVFNDLFISDTNDTNLYWTNFTLQSPLAPTITDYTQLASCILDQTCDFLDNRIELTEDPENASNQVLKFISVAPNNNIVTSKSSLISTINYYTLDTNVWYEADYYIESGMPFSIVDFENTYFEQTPGPRIVIRNNKLELENKFGEKLNYSNTSAIEVPTGEWFTIKVHLKYSNENNGIIEVWQNGNIVISTTGINLPTSNSIQNKLEVGATASSVGCTMYFDNMRISETSF